MRLPILLMDMAHAMTKTVIAKIQGDAHMNRSIRTKSTKPIADNAESITLTPWVNAGTRTVPM